MSFFLWSGLLDFNIRYSDTWDVTFTSTYEKLNNKVIHIFNNKLFSLVIWGLFFNDMYESSLRITQNYSSMKVFHENDETLKLRIPCIIRFAATEQQHLCHNCKALIITYKLISKVYGKESKSFTHPFNFRTNLNLKWHYNAKHNLYIICVFVHRKIGMFEFYLYHGFSFACRLPTEELISQWRSPKNCSESYCLEELNRNCKGQKPNLLKRNKYCEYYLIR